LFDDEREKLVSVCGDFASFAEQALIKFAGGNNLAVAEGTRRRLAAMRVELAGPNPTPLERLLGERIALCWAAVNEYERRYHAAAKELSIAQTDSQMRRITAATRRYLMAIRTLAQIRKLAVPSILGSIGKRPAIAATPLAG
jgi:hypothetical protein